MTDPYRVLGVARTADDAAIRAAYLAAVRNCPPDRDAERFAHLRSAYDAVATQRARLGHDLFDCQAPTANDVSQMLAEEFSPRCPDAAALLEVLKGSGDGR